MIENDILSGSTEAVRALADSDAVAWRTVLEHAITHPDEVAPGTLVRAMLAVDSEVERWLERAKNAAARTDSALFTTVAKALHPFRAWWLGGVAAAMPFDSPQSVAARFETLLRSSGDDALEQLQAFLAALPADAAVAGFRPRALLLLARRAMERGAHHDAEQAAQKAEELFAAAGRLKEAAAATRARGAALLRLGRFDEAFALLDPVLDKPGPLFGGEGVHVLRAIEDPRENARDEVATIGMWATKWTPEWVRALGILAEIYSDASLGETAHGSALQSRFEAALDVLTQRDDSEKVRADLKVIVRQARERGRKETARAAEARLRRS